MFVYGTLMPLEAAWPLLEPYAAEAPREAEVPGTLYRTHNAWPVAVFDTGCATLVPGSLVTLRRGLEAAAMTTIDRYEDLDAGLFRRIEVRTVDGAPAEAYHWVGPLTDFEVIPAWRAGMRRSP